MILGLNRRELAYIAPCNPREAILGVAQDKVNAKRLLAAHGLPVADDLAVLRSHAEARRFDWGSLPDAFALKPGDGALGCGIVVAASRAHEGWLGVGGARLPLDRLRLHVIDILDGVYSREGFHRGVAYFEERLRNERDLWGEPASGLADIRVIVYRGSPALAMTRIPTKESGGKANLHQGAVGAGIDLGTGKTTHAVHRGRSVDHHPDHGRRLLGLVVPDWPEILEIAVSAARVSGLGYAGVDVVRADERGIRILEINARPGLDIQIANLRGLAGVLRDLDRAHGAAGGPPRP